MLVDDALHLIAETLDPLERLAVAYAPRRVRAAWVGLLALDRRLAEAAREGREPLIVQIRLAWWRDRFAEPATAWPGGEPLLALLAPWDAERSALTRLVDAREAEALGDEGEGNLSQARLEAMVALARLSKCGAEDAVRRAAAQWQGIEPGGGAPRLPRAMRPLAVLRALAVRERAGKPASAVRTLLTVVRFGLIGR